jgi:hypothetical protein
METLHKLHASFPWLLPLISGLMIWEALWKIIALWKAGSRKQLAWFICIAVINTAGILPIIYLIVYRKRSSKTT